MVALHIAHKGIHQLRCDAVHPVVVVAVLGEVALHLVIHHDAVRVADAFHPGVLDGREGIRHHGKPRDARGEPAGHLLVVQRHLQLFVAVFIVHIMDDVQRVHIHLRQPLHHVPVLFHHVVVIQIIPCDGTVPGPHLLFGDLIHTAVDGIQQALGQVGARTEELHLLAYAHGGHAARNGVIVAMGHAHQVVVLVLHAGRFDGGFRTEALEAFRQTGGPQHRQVGLRRGAQILQRVQVTVGHFGDHVPPVDAHAADGFRHPLRVAGEQVVVFGRAGKLDEPELHDEVVHKLLDLPLGVNARRKVALGVHVQERGGAAQAHGRAVLLLYRRKIPEVQPLDGLTGVLRRTGDIEAVDLPQLFQVVQRADLLAELLPLADDVGIHDDAGGVLLVPFVLDQPVHAVQRHTAVIADDAAPTVGVRQAGDDMAGAAGPHFGRICVEHARVVRFAVCCKKFHDLRVHMIAVVLAGLLRHADAAVGHQRPLERLFRLKAHDGLFLLVQIARRVGGDGGDDAGVHVQHAARLALGSGKLQHLLPKRLRVLRRPGKERVVPVIGCIIFLDEVPDVDFFFPYAGHKAGPFVSHA